MATVLDLSSANIPERLYQIFDMNEVQLFSANNNVHHTMVVQEPVMKVQFLPMDSKHPVLRYGNRIRLNYSNGSVGIDDDFEEIVFWMVPKVGKDIHLYVRDSSTWTEDANVFEVVSLRGRASNEFVDDPWAHNHGDPVRYGDVFALKSVTSRTFMYKSYTMYISSNGSNMVLSEEPTAFYFTDGQGKIMGKNGIECTQQTVATALNELGIDLHTPCQTKAAITMPRCHETMSAYLDTRTYEYKCAPIDFTEVVELFRAKLGDVAAVSIMSQVSQYSAAANVLGKDASVKMKEWTEYATSEIRKHNLVSPPEYENLLLELVGMITEEAVILDDEIERMPKKEAQSTPLPTQQLQPTKTRDDNTMIMVAAAIVALLILMS